MSVQSPPRSPEDYSRRSLFVGGIPEGTADFEVWRHFEHYGEVATVDILLDHRTGRPCRYALVHFTHPELSDRALADQHVINGQRVDVRIERFKRTYIYRPGDSCMIHIALSSPSDENNLTIRYLSQFGIIRNGELLINGIHECYTEDGTSCWVKIANLKDRHEPELACCCNMSKYPCSFAQWGHITPSGSMLVCSGLDGHLARLAANSYGVHAHAGNGNSIYGYNKHADIDTSRRGAYLFMPPFPSPATVIAYYYGVDGRLTGYKCYPVGTSRLHIQHTRRAVNPYGVHAHAGTDNRRCRCNYNNLDRDENNLLYMTPFLAVFVMAYYCNADLGLTGHFCDPYE